MNLLASLGTWTSVFPPAFHSLLVYSLFVMMIHISRPDERAISLAYLLMNSNTSHQHHRHHHKHHRSALLHSNLLCFNRRRHDCCLCRQYLLAVQGSCRSRERKDLEVLEKYSSSKFSLPSSSRSHFQSERLSRITRRSDGTDGSSSVFFQYIERRKEEIRENNQPTNHECMHMPGQLSKILETDRRCDDDLASRFDQVQ